MTPEKKKAADRQRTVERAIKTFDALMGTRKFTGRAKALKEITNAPKPTMAARRLAKALYAVAAEEPVVETDKPHVDLSDVQETTVALLRTHGWIGQNHMVMFRKLIWAIAGNKTTTRKRSAALRRIAATAPEITDPDRSGADLLGWMETDRYWEEARRATRIRLGFSPDPEPVSLTGSYLGDIKTKAVLHPPTHCSSVSEDMLDIPTFLERR